LAFILGLSAARISGINDKRPKARTAHVTVIGFIVGWGGRVR
jgi:hypothetical protein